MKLLILLIASILFSGCTDAFDARPAQEAPTETSLLERRAPKPEHDIVPTKDGIATDQGYYQKLSMPTTINLSYYDFATMQHIAVCSSPNCTHGDETCSAFMGYDIMQIVSAGDTGELIYYRTGSEQDGTPYFKLELYDATNRFIRELATFNYSINIMGSSADRIYVCESNERYLSVDVQTGNKTQLFSDYQYTQATNLSLSFYSSSHMIGDSIYVVKKKPVGQIDGDANSYEDLPEEAVATLYRVDVNTGLISEMYSETVSTFDMPAYTFYNNTLIITHSSGNRVYNLQDGTLTALPPVVTQPGDSVYTVMPMYFIDGYITYIASNSEYPSELYYHQNIATGETIKSTLTYEATIDVTYTYTSALPIIADLGEQLIVGISQHEYMSNYTAPDGQYTQLNTFMNTALITEEDYFANNPNFQPFNNSTIVNNLNG